MRKSLIIVLLTVLALLVNISIIYAMGSSPQNILGPDGISREVNTNPPDVSKNAVQSTEYTNGALLINDGYFDFGRYSIFAKILQNNGLNVEEQSINPITLNTLTSYKIVVMAGMADREISQSEADALVAYVKNGGKLLLLGEFYYGGWSDKWNKSFDIIGSAFGVKSQYNKTLR